MKKLFWVLILLAPVQVFAQKPGNERILSYDSEIVVHVDGSQTVTETIRVRAAGDRIKRGIYRDFPTTYKANGRRYKVDFQVVEVRRDGRPEAWHTKRLANGIRVYIGRSNVFLEPGVYSYRLTYYTNRQLGFFQDHDELYWNVTGNGWDFAIEQVGARVLLPPDVPIEEVGTEAYTGRQGASGQGYAVHKGSEAVEFRTTRPLGPREGLTIVAQWPKGYVIEPVWRERLVWQWRDEPGLFIVWGGVLLLLLYYWLVWLAVGRDPAAGIIVPEYEPPHGYTPAAIRLIRRMGYDDKTLSAALVNLAVRGAITLRESNDVYTATPTGQRPDGLGADEQALLDAVGPGGITFSRSLHEKIRAMIDAHEEKLEARYRKRYYYANRGWVIPGWLITVLVLAAAGWGSLHVYGPEAIFLLFLSGFIAAFALPFFLQLWRMRQPYHRRASGWVKLFAAGLPLVFLGGMLILSEFAGLLWAMPWQMLGGVGVLVLINLVFNHLLKAPTLKGRRLLDKIEGFRQYLSLAEGDELKARYARAVTPEIFEAYLPYAIALDVETPWADRFAQDLRKAGQDPTRYQSRWYDGSDFRGVRGISSSVSGALASSVASASTPPGSSSGSGGGGSSGGGGGGGGGGGW